MKVYKKFRLLKPALPVFFMKIYRQKHSSGHKWAKVEFEQPKMGLVPLSTMLPPDPPISQTFQTRWFWQDWYVQMCKCSGSAFFWQIQTVYQELFFPFWFNLTNNPGKVNVVKFFFWISSLTKAFSEYCMFRHWKEASRASRRGGSAGGRGIFLAQPLYCSFGRGDNEIRQRRKIRQDKKKREEKVMVMWVRPSRVCVLCVDK